MRHNKISKLLLCAVVAFGGLSFGSASARAAEKVSIGTGIALAWAPAYIAEEQGFFKAHGLEPTVLLFPSGRAAQEAIVGNAVAWGTVAETPVMFAAMNGLPVRIIGTMAIYEVFDIAARADIKSAGDLKGKRVGYAQGTNAQVYLSRALKKAGLTADDITAINLNPSDMVTSLVNEQIDAFIWTEPHLSQAMTVGNGALHMIRMPELYKTYSSIVTTQETINKNPKVLVSSLMAMMDAVKYMNEKKQEAITSVASKIRMDPDIAQKEWERIPFAITLNKEQMVQEMQEQAEWAIKNGLVQKGTSIPDFETIVVDKIYKQASKAHQE